MKKRETALYIREQNCLPFVAHTRVGCVFWRLFKRAKIDSLYDELKYKERKYHHDKFEAMNFSQSK